MSGAADNAGPAATAKDGKPSRNCPLCPRLKEFREGLRRRQPTWFNAPVPCFGTPSARLLIVGLAPGLQGANRTGRPFTGDYAGVLLYATLARFGFARGNYAAHSADGLELVDARITNAVRCVPPQNKPTSAEIATCRRFLNQTIAEMPQLAAILALGRIAHESVLAVLEQPPKPAAFGHGASYSIGNVRLFSSYHCSRLNTNTGVLTPDMFHSVFSNIRSYLDNQWDVRTQDATK
ncbi:MAG TPA: uracil-DNA glycosylase [Xanthobacteraceae bacterium]|jgi:uracil-DNA glycosylase family 4